MKKKKNIKKDSELALTFTGKMSIIAELDGTGPMQFRINDKDFVKRVINIILDNTDNTVNVDAYNKREETKLQKMMDDIA